jgi:hypothetical protein
LFFLAIKSVASAKRLSETSVQYLGVAKHVEVVHRTFEYSSYEKLSFTISKCSKSIGHSIL